MSYRLYRFMLLVVVCGAAAAGIAVRLFAARVPDDPPAERTVVRLFTNRGHEWYEFEMGTVLQHVRVDSISAVLFASDEEWSTTIFFGGGKLHNTLRIEQFLELQEMEDEYSPTVVD